jgi:predicted nucleotidyltransferase
MKKTLDVQAEHLAIIEAILRAQLSPAATVWAFGSRVSHTAKPFSDLDLAIDMGYPMPLILIAELSHQFDESDLPFKVDVIDWAALDEVFREKIRSHQVQLFP